MDETLLKKHIRAYLEKAKVNQRTFETEKAERALRSAYYRSWTADRLKGMSEEELYEYLAKLWAMRIWGNKQYVIDKLISNHGLETVRVELAELVWSTTSLPKRWDRFRERIRGVGPGMMSEILCHVHPEKCMLWNRRVYLALDYLEEKGLPRYNYQLTGDKYQELCGVASRIVGQMSESGDRDADMFSVDYFLWSEIPVEGSLSQVGKRQPQGSTGTSHHPEPDPATADFIHNEVRDKIADIGQWLGLQSRTEVKVAAGSKVDAIWESTIGNLGRVIYVFEVQTKGSIDSLIVNLLKSLNNPAVQGVVAVSDTDQLERIKAHASAVSGLNDKLKYWDYTEVLEVHEALEGVNAAINQLGLVPQPF